MNQLENENRDQLISKLKTARREIVVLKQEQQIKSAIQKEKTKIEHILRERVKELNCLYGIAKIIEENENDTASMMKAILDLLLISWQYPDITTGRIIFKSNHYTAPNFKITPWKQSADIIESGEKTGAIEIYYLDEMPDIDDGPFLKEERLLINAVSIRISKAIERINAKSQLEIEQKSLQRANITLKEVLLKVKEEKNETGKAIHENVDKMIIPLLNSLKTEAYPEQVKIINLIQQNLEEIVSPFINILSERFMELTLVELQICTLIRNGLSTKEIATLRRISHMTVNRHRENIRKKLELTNTKVNLPTFLSNFMTDSRPRNRALRTDFTDLGCP